MKGYIPPPALSGSGVRVAGGACLSAKAQRFVLRKLPEWCTTHMAPTFH
jgi:hypothetical protein